MQNDETQPITSPAPLAIAPAISWEKDPQAFFNEKCSDGIHSALKALEEPMEETCLATAQGHPSRDGKAHTLARLLILFSTSYRFDRDEDATLEWGSFRIPASPLGLRTIKTFKLWAGRMNQAPFWDLVSEESALGKTCKAIMEASRAGSVLLRDFEHRTSREEPSGMAKIHIVSDTITMRALPQGGNAPRSLRTLDLVGVEISGDEAQEIRSDHDLCDEGSAEFFNRYGIDFEQEGTYECDSCGTEHESEDSGTITYVSDFTITEEMATFLERRDYAQEMRDWLQENGEETFPDWESWVSEFDVPAYLAKLDANGIEWGEDWHFEPDFEALISEDDEETPELAVLLKLIPKLQSIVEGCQTIGKLPPIPGTLYHGPRSESSRYHKGWEWSPQAGRMTHKTPNGLALIYNAQSGRLLLEGGGKTHIIGRNSQGVLFFQERGSEGGLIMDLWLRAFQAKASL